MPSLAAGRQKALSDGCRARIRSSGAAFCFLLLLFYGLAPALAPGASLEYQVKAAFLFNFTKFVEWPSSAFADASSPFLVCIFGSDPFGRALDDIIEGESVEGHKITVQRINTETPQACHVLYSGENTMPPWSTAAASSVLTVGEGDRVLSRGGIIAFVIDNGRVRFDISLKAASKQGLKLSSKLLSVARNVER